MARVHTEAKPEAPGKRAAPASERPAATAEQRDRNTHLLLTAWKVLLETRRKKR
jgi:hypothetical protein